VARCVVEIAIKKYLGSGLYTVREAALYARVRESLMRRWLFGTKDRRAVIDPQFGPDDRLVSFLDLVQTLAIREIRLMHNIPVHKFRQAIRWVKKNLGVDYPFARRHFTYLFDDQLVVELKRGQYVEVTGRSPGQGLLEFVELYLTDLSFDKSGLARKYQIFKSEDVPVVMDPDVRFGEPMLPSGYSAKCIWDAIKAEGSIDNAARAYGIPREEVRVAYRLFDHLGAATA
jgi:hypothetical protein